MRDSEDMRCEREQRLELGCRELLPAASLYRNDLHSFQPPRSLVFWMPLAVEKSFAHDSEFVSSNHVAVISIRAASQSVSSTFRRCEETASREKSSPPTSASSLSPKTAHERCPKLVSLELNLILNEVVSFSIAG